MSLDPLTVPASSIVPTDPTIGIAIVATVMLTISIIVMMYLTFSPSVPDEWAENVGQKRSLEANEAD